MESYNLGQLFIKVDDLMLSWTAGRLDKPFSITTFFALDYLAPHSPASMKSLAHALDITPASVTALSNKLEKAGWIRREPHPEDRRSHLLSITPAGSEILNDDYRTMQSFFDQHLNTEDQKTLMTLFQRIILHTGPGLE
jgi:DNA-binding MarR family transcriptional regulator